MKSESVYSSRTVNIKHCAEGEAFKERLLGDEPDVVIFFVRYNSLVRCISRMGAVKFKPEIQLHPFAWSWLLELFPVHPRFLEALSQPSGTFSTFSARHLDEPSKPPTTVYSDNFYIILKTPATACGEEALYLRYNLQHTRLYGLVMSSDLSDLYSTSMEHVSLQCSAHIHPFGVLNALAEVRFSYINERMRQCNEERTQGSRPETYPDMLCRRLTPKIGLLCQHHRHQRELLSDLKFQLDIVTFMDKNVYQYNAFRKEHADPELRDIKSSSLRETFRSRISTLKGGLDYWQAMSDITKSRIEEARVCSLSRVRASLT